mmetsp:Transcript_32415/g.61041  ORF Transcript_32415/g.61041 Transcript_32415/m.61041 type:complete len:241 (+) Transcript_32415:57-779(+)
MAPGQYSMDAKQHTMSPVVTGATVIGMKYKDGVIVASDTLASYGNEARYKDVCRLMKVGDFTLVGGGGEYSDFQYLGDMLREMADEDWLHEDGCSLGPKEYASYIGRVMYNRRSKMNPLYNQFVVVGKKKDQPPHLAYVDHQGTAFEENFVATGFGAYLGIPLLRNGWRADMSLEEAKALATKVLEVCFYRDCKAYTKIQIGVCDGNTADITTHSIDHFWGHTAWTEARLADQGESIGTW